MSEPIPEIVACWQRAAAVMPPTEPANPDDPSVSLDTLAAIAHAKWGTADALAAELERANEALRQIEAAIKLVPGMWQDVILDAALAEERCPICGGSSFHGHHGTLPGDCGEEQAK